MARDIYETKRLIVRQLTLSDQVAFHDLQSNPNVMKYTGQPAMNKEAAFQDLKQVITHYSDPSSGFRVWGVFKKDVNEMVGTVALISQNGQHEIGFRIRETFWGKGFGAEVTFGLLEYSFTQIKSDKVFAEVDQRNIASVRILDKTLRRIRSFYNEETKTDDYYYELTHSEYEQIRHTVRSRIL